MNSPEKNINLTVVRASHSILDIGTTTRLFQRTIPRLFKAEERNIGIFEEVGYTRDGAYQFKDQVKDHKSAIFQRQRDLVESDLGITQRRRIQQVTRILLLQKLAYPPLTEEAQPDLHLTFWESLLRNTDINLEIFPESLKDEDKLKSIRETSINSTEREVTEPRTLEEIIEMNLRPITEAYEVAAERDPEIADFFADLVPTIEREQKETKTNIVVLIGCDHDQIGVNLDAEVQRKVNYREIVIKQHGEGALPDNLMLDPELTREKAARAIFFKTVMEQMKKMFLSENQDVRLKEFQGVTTENSVVHQMLEMCMTVPIEVIYMLLQEIYKVDCGLQQQDYPNTELPHPFDKDPQTFMRKLLNFTTKDPINDLDKTDIGKFVDQQMAINAIWVLLNMPESPRLRLAFEDILQELESTFYNDLVAAVKIGVTQQMPKEFSAIYKLIKLVVKINPHSTGKSESFKLVKDFLLNTNRARKSGEKVLVDFHLPF